MSPEEIVIVQIIGIGLALWHAYKLSQLLRERIGDIGREPTPLELTAKRELERDG